MGRRLFSSLQLLTWILCLLLSAGGCSQDGFEDSPDGDAGEPDGGGFDGWGDLDPGDDLWPGDWNADVDVTADFSGVYASLQISSHYSVVPMVGDVQYRNIALCRVSISQQGAQLTVDTEICSLESESDTDLVQTVFPDAFVRSLPVIRRPAAVMPAAGGYRFFVPRFYEVRGVELADPERDPLPTDPTDPRIQDPDGDRNPGLTVRITGIVDGEVYVIQRTWSVMDGQAPEAGEIQSVSGLIAWGDEQVVLGSDNPVLESPREGYIDPVPENSHFDFKRVASGKSCADIIAERDALFPP
jgi:hypothetical protein